jgi:iron complex transport system substrate-binding protein
MRRIWMPVSILLIAALLASTIVLAALYATRPTRSEVLAGLTPAEAATMSALAPILAFSPEDVPGEVGGEPFIDDLGREVSIPGASPVESIVCLNPAATETIFYLGADDKLVAVSSAWFNDYEIHTPEDVINEIRQRFVEGETAFDWYPQWGIYPSPEVIIGLEPDVIFIFAYTFPEWAQAFEQVEPQIPVVVFAPETLADILYDIIVIGKIVEREEDAESLVKDIKAQFVEIAGITIDQPRPKVLYETWYDGGIMTTGEGSFISGLIILAGGEDIGTAVPVSNPVISAEYVINSAPEKIILWDAPWGVTAESVAERPGWNTIPAVITWQANPEEGIYELDGISQDLLGRPGPGIAQGLMALLGIIHPELSP